MFWEKFTRLCTEKGTYPTVVCEAIGLNKSAATNYKRGGIPTPDNMKKIADYLGVNISYFLEDTPQQRNEDEVEMLRRQLAERPELKALLTASTKLSSSDIMVALRVLEGLAK